MRPLPCIAALVFAGACSHPSTQAPELALTPIGTWAVCITGAVPDSTGRAVTRYVTGQVVIDGTRPLRRMGFDALPGSYVADFAPLLRFDLQSRNTDVVLLRLATDTVQLQFSPFGGFGSMSADDGSVIARGRLFGDSVSGAWWQTSYARGPEGAFRMVRADRGGVAFTATCRP